MGSNLGPREAHLQYASRRLGARLTDVRISSVRETDPENGAPGPRFLNAVVVGRSSAAPPELLDALLEIEAERGRTRPFGGAPRTLDLDLILVGDIVARTPALTLPHPRFRTRRFVLEPLVQVAPDVVDPVTGLTARALLARLPAD